MRVIRPVELRVEKYPAGNLGPASLIRMLEADEPCCVWESGSRKADELGFTSHRNARFSVLAVYPAAVCCLSRNILSVKRESGEMRYELAAGENPFDVLSEHFGFLRSAESIKLPDDLPPIPFTGGLIGFVAYDCGRLFEPIKGSSSSSTEPDLFLLNAPAFFVFDRDRDEILFCHYPDACDAAQVRRCKDLYLSASRGEQPENCEKTIPCSERFSREEFVSRVERIQEYIRAGDIFQAVFANTFETKEPTDPLIVFNRLRKQNPSAYHFLVRFGNQTLVGASPEVMVRGGRNRRGEIRIQMRLVAGTYPRGAVIDHSRDQAARLGTDTKELAEHLMLVDHARNDIGRIARIGTVEVSDLFSIETYADVHHLVSQVSGALRPDKNVIDAFQSCFPIATLTGTPKIRAMEIIAEVEGPSRGIFGGAVVTFGYDGSIDSAVAIRSLITGENGTKVQAGAGIVYDSIPSREYDECRWKANAVFGAAGLL